MRKLFASRAVAVGVKSCLFLRELSHCGRDTTPFPEVTRTKIPRRKRAGNKASAPSAPPAPWAGVMAGAIMQLARYQRGLMRPLCFRAAPPALRALLPWHVAFKTPLPRADGGTRRLGPDLTRISQTRDAAARSQTSGRIA